MYWFIYNKLIDISEHNLNFEYVFLALITIFIDICPIFVPVLKHRLIDISPIPFLIWVYYITTWEYYASTIMDVCQTVLTTTASCNYLSCFLQNWGIKTKKVLQDFLKSSVNTHWIILPNLASRFLITTLNRLQILRI